MSLKSLYFSVSHYLQRRQFLVFLVSVCVAVVLSSCDTVTTDQYDATALTTLTWQVQYSTDPVNDKQPRFEEFASNSLLNRNGEKPQNAVIGPDDKGLWWPKLPPRPSIDEVEQRQKAGEQASKPELLRIVKYEMTYQQSGQKVTLPTNYDVYRQVARAYPSRKPLQLTLGVNNASVTKAKLAD
ncbi:hypothetical protein [Allocoleopsis sp.]|uniref:hypothetical protein n=1 Tax=Allocoleopsis sp. TaxID=3088169 RepID=UPI002FD35EE7